MMITVAVTAASVAVFLIAFHVARVLPEARRAIVISRDAVASMWDPSLDDDDAREIAVRRAALTLFATSGSLTLRGFAAIAAAVLPIVLADWAGIVAHEQILAFIERLDVIVITALIALIAYAGARAWSR